MDKRTLVESDFIDGAKLIAELDKSPFHVHSALWLFDEERDSWRLVIASENVNNNGPKKAYEAIYEVLKGIEKKVESFGVMLDNISAVGTNYTLIQKLGTAINTGPEEISGIRFTRKAVGNNYIEDAYIYRMQ